MVVNVRDAVAVLNYMDYFELGTWGDGMPWGESEERATAVAKKTGYNPWTVDWSNWTELGWLVDEVVDRTFPPATPAWATYAWSGTTPPSAPAIVIDETHVWNRDQMELAKEAVKRCLKG